MSDHEQPIIIIKKIKKTKAGHHGGAWKIAYADFVTAMMAFFMLLWLLSMLNKYQLQGISAYFKRPLSDVFVGSKNSEHYKNQSKSHIVDDQNETSGTTNPDTAKKDLQSGATKAAKIKSNANSKEKDSPSKAAEKKEAGGFSEDMSTLKRKLEIALENDTAIKQFKDNLTFEIVKDGIKISLQDTNKTPMFSLGKADFQNYARHVITWLSGEFNQVPKRIMIIGHTDTYQYGESAAYTNWELSVERANVVRRLLIADGMEPHKIIRVEGAADVSLKNKKYGDDPANRRVEIIVLTNEAAKRIINE